MLCNVKFLQEVCNNTHILCSEVATEHLLGIEHSHTVQWEWNTHILCNVKLILNLLEQIVTYMLKKYPQYVSEKTVKMLGMSYGLL